MKILYLMHIDWNWIKQRPHFMAEYLGKAGIEVDLYYNKGNFTKTSIKKNENININIIPKLRGERFIIIKKINRLIYFLFIKSIQVKEKYDYIYISHPTMYIKGIKTKIIYDCMDDCLAFDMSKKEKKIVSRIERNLLRKAELVIFSADFLCNTVIKRCNFELKKTIVVNNAIEIPDNNLDLEKKNNNENEIICSYIGTIADWFDFDLLSEVKNKIKEKNIIYNLYGPEAYGKINFHKKDFNFMGSVSHDKIFDIMNNSDILIMPFKVTELILSVNPVKLYEYIYSGKPVVSVKYGESQKFSDAVYLYENGNVNSLLEIIKEISNNGFKSKLTLDECRNYVLNNTWKNRVDQLIKVL